MQNSLGVVGKFVRLARGFFELTARQNGDQGDGAGFFFLPLGCRRRVQEMTRDFVKSVFQPKTAETPNRAEIVQSEKPLTIGDDNQFLSDSLPSVIKVRVAISRSEDLRVSVGQKIKTGDVIADRKREERRF